MRSGVSARTGTNRMSLVNNEIGSILASQFTQSFVITRVRMNDADVGHDGFGKDGGHITRREHSFKRANIIELDYL